MSADTRLEELGVSGPGEVDEPEFSGPAERHRRELHVHCCRMLGSFEDAEDTVQETFLRAWRRRETFFAKVGDNLRAGKIRMVFVADAIPDDLRRIVEFLNEQMNRRNRLWPKRPAYRPALSKESSAVHQP
ncbi:sigma factor [Microbispora bryophytorum]|uniref:sigma factor n=1 Tax=Microbispora bryophytorum TaxID=1460882 RepID=UPI0033F34762